MNMYEIQNYEKEIKWGVSVCVWEGGGGWVRKIKKI